MSQVTAFTPSMLAGVKGNSDEQRVAVLLREQILGGAFPIDSFLPPAKQLCEQLGVSLPVFGNAMRELKRQGLIYGTRGVQYRVLPRPPVRRLSSDRYTDQITALREGREAHCSFCADYKIDHVQHTVRITSRMVNVNEIEPFGSWERERQTVANFTGWKGQVHERRIVEYANQVPIQIRTSWTPKHIGQQFLPVAGDGGVASAFVGGILAELNDVGQLPDTWYESRPVTSINSVDAYDLDVDDSVSVYSWERLFYRLSAATEFSLTIIPVYRVIFAEEGSV